MIVKTKHVANRRSIQFHSLDEILAEAERLAAASPTMLGNWSLGQTFAHLARAMDIAVDGFPFRVARVWGLIGPLIKKRFLTKPMPAGFQLRRTARDALVPAATSTEEGLAALRRSIERFRRGPLRARHEILGAMSAEDWEQLQRRHAELHLSFALTNSD